MQKGAGKHTVLLPRPYTAYVEFILPEKRNIIKPFIAYKDIDPYKRPYYYVCYTVLHIIFWKRKYNLCKPNFFYRRNMKTLLMHNKVYLH